MIAYIFSWIIVGFIVGALARLLVPGRQDIGMGMTIVLGIVGSLVGGFVAWLLFVPRTADFNLASFEIQHAWPGWIMAVFGAFLVLWAFVSAKRRGPTI